MISFNRLFIHTQTVCLCCSTRSRLHQSSSEVTERNSLPYRLHCHTVVTSLQRWIRPNGATARKCKVSLKYRQFFNHSRHPHLSSQLLAYHWGLRYSQRPYFCRLLAEFFSKEVFQSWTEHTVQPINNFSSIKFHLCRIFFNSNYCRHWHEIE